MSESKPIITYCVEQAKTSQSQCAACKKNIAQKFLRVAEIYRKSKKVKKDQAKHTWYHFKCFKVPELLTILPIENFRGYPALNEKDQDRVRRLIAGGVGATWPDIVAKTKADAEADAQAEEGDEEKPVKAVKRKEPENEDIDMTADLTGTQESSKKKKVEKVEKVSETGVKTVKEIVKKSESSVKVEKTKSGDKAKAEKTKKKTDKDDKKKLSKKDDKKKVSKKQPKEEKVKEVVLPKEDQLELENIAKEFLMLKQ
ncbi:hypothetical protein BDB01DRAFT_837352 [Pilobolus umbonatus]|nr:hypothetical protein BDB01DRAFT_837352 [Pilobolus umbonatus]